MIRTEIGTELPVSAESIVHNGTVSDPFHDATEGEPQWFDKWTVTFVRDDAAWPFAILAGDGSVVDRCATLGKAQAGADHGGFPTDEGPYTAAEVPDPGGRLTVPYYMGLGHNGKSPTGEEVMETLLAGAAQVDRGDGEPVPFGEWADEWGIEAGGIAAAERLYGRMRESAGELRRFLGEHFTPALWGYED